MPYDLVAQFKAKDRPQSVNALVMYILLATFHEAPISQTWKGI